MTNRDPRTYAIIGAAMEVHRQLGHGFLEKVYQEALAIEFDLRGIPFKREIELPIFYKNTKLATHYRADFLCFDNIIVELKALSKISGAETSQVLNYLKATNCKIGLLLNFGTPSLKYDRFIN
ncbi:MAG: GxxExxY protein [Chloroflexota bacterium]